MVNKRWIKSVFVHDQLAQLKSELLSDSVFDGAASLAYYLTLAIFPGIIFVFTLLPYLSLPDLNSIFANDLLTYLPTRAANTLQSAMFEVMNKPSAGVMSLSFIGGLWAASSGAAALMTQINNVYEIRERRSFWHTRLVALLLTFALTILLLSALVIIVAGGLFIPDGFLTFLRWVVTLILIYSAMSVIYFIAPDTQRLNEPFKFFTPGSWAATFLILVSTGLLSLYLKFFDSYNRIYGSITGVIVLMIWFYLVGIAILMGAQINHFVYRKIAAYGGIRTFMVEVSRTFRQM